MGFPFHCYQNVRSHMRGDIYRKIQLPGSVLVGPVRAVIRRFPQTSSALFGALTRVLLALLLTFLLSPMAPFQNSRAQTVDTSKAAPQTLKQLSLEQPGNLEVTTV